MLPKLLSKRYSLRPMTKRLKEIEDVTVDVLNRYIISKNESDENKQSPQKNLPKN